MAEVITLALSFPSVVFTVLLGVVLVYWLFVMTGVLHLGEGSDGALNAGDALAGASKGALEGAAKGALEGATKGLLDGAAHAAAGHDGAIHGLQHGGVAALHSVDVDADLSVDARDGGDSGLMAAILSALRLRQIPATVALSVLIAFSWLVSVVAMQIIARIWVAGPGTLLSLGILIVSPMLALPLSSLVCVPLSKAITQRKAPTKGALIGMTCRVRTGKVTDRFGEATLEDGGAGLILRVRVDGESQLKRGDLALIVDFDKEQDSFLVEPMDRLLGDSKPS
jgi:hypothetical protein